MATGIITNPFTSPNYSSSSTIVSGAGNQYTITKPGWVHGIGANGANAASKPLFRLEINGTIVAAVTGRDENYTYIDTGLYPVKAGDVVKIYTGTFSGTNTIDFIPL